MGRKNDDVLKIRLPSKLKTEVSDAAATHPETSSISEFVRLQLRAGKNTTFLKYASSST